MLSSKKRRSLSTSLIKVLAILALLFVVLPFIALLFRIEWSNFFAHIFTSENWSAIQLTFVTSLISLLVALVVGLPLAFLMATNSAWKRLRAVMAIPLVLPPVVGGVLLLVAWGRRGVFGSSLFHLFGYSIPFTLVAVIFAQLFVALPIVVTMAEGAFLEVPRDLIDAARADGASEGVLFWRIAIPSAASGIAAAALLAFARALGEFGATITFAGSLPGLTRTLPTAIYAALEADPASALSLSLVLVLMSGILMVLMRRRLFAWVR